VSESPPKGPEKGQNPISAIAAENGRGQASLEKVRQVLTPLGRTEKSRLFEMVSQGELQHAQMGRNIARILVELLNGARTEHARRLWTGWFDPILVRDDLTLLCESRLPACLHVIDAGAWWFALSRFMERLTGEIQTTVTELARDLPLEQVFSSAGARVWSDDLRRESLAVLASCRGKPQVINRLVTEANGHRARLTKERGFRNAAPFTAADIATLEFMLETAPAWKTFGRSAVATEADALLKVSQRLVRDDKCSVDGGCGLALARVHGHREPDFALRVFDAFNTPLARDAIVGHFEFAVQRLRQWLESRWIAKPVQVHSTIEQLQPDALLRNVFGWYDAAGSVDAGQDERARTMMNMALSRLIAIVEMDVTQTVTQRILAMNQRSAPAPLVEAVLFISAFHTGFTKRDVATSGRSWVPAVGEHVVGLFNSLVSASAAEPKPDQDVLALARLAELAALVGGRVEITALNIALISVVEQCLRRRTEWAPLERRLIDRVVTMSREERRRSKWWVSEEIKNLLEIAEQRGLESARI
jgi:hypothetical protein